MLSYRFFNKIKNKAFSLIFNYFFSHSFKKYGENNRILWPDTIDGAEYIIIENRVVIRNGAWLLALKNDNFEPKIEIHNNVYIGRHSHIVSVNSVIIKSNVLIADKVYISDNIHQYKDINVPIKDQPVLFKGAVTINEGAWLGENVCIIGASVGKNSVVAANSVVTRDVPDYTVVAGAPAKVIKKFNFKSQDWESV
ncbi:acyltransferase [Aeromonas encheleia]|uniref:acyltransferase n=1 Tax=Aeromonas TaxID=642 RepID=UPI001C488D7E|nr:MULTISPECIES: acyltransferase [Aeromonas]MBV7598800.1 acyltransferase [Aeromonas sp. sia0103]UNP89665.1 acyltransferase [Aeromonas encheleia]